jgi:rhodanese-related sulfurtransferase
MVRDWTRDEVSKGLAGGTILLVDVREPHEFAMAHIPGSTSMPLSQFTPEALAQTEGRTIVFSCAAGIRSLRALDLAQAAGLEADSHYGGGFKDWLMSGGPVEQG